MISRDYLRKIGVPSMVYYPVPLHMQKAYYQIGFGEVHFLLLKDFQKR